MIKLGVIGLGAAGNNVAALAKERKIPAIAINSSERDIDSLKTALDVLVINGNGAGLDREIGKDYVKNHIREILQNESFTKFMGEVDYVFVVNSTGGGTGSSFGPILTDILSKYYASEEKRKTFINIGILPSTADSIGNQRNTLEYLKEMTDLGMSYMLFDNNNKTGAPKETFEAVNKAIVNTISVFAGNYSRLSTYGMIDEMDLHKLLTMPGMIFVDNLQGIYAEKIKDTLEDNVLENISKTLMVHPDKDKIVKRRGYITNLSKDLHSYFNQGLPKITEAFGEPIESFSHFGENEDEDEKANYFILILSGLSLPDNRLKSIINRIEAVEEALAKKKESSLLDSALSKVSVYNGTRGTIKKSEEFDLDSIMGKY